MKRIVLGYILFFVLIFQARNCYSQHVITTNETKLPTESLEPSQFQALPFEQKRLMVLQWINQSLTIQIPTDFKEQAKAFYKQEPNGLAVCEKYGSLFRPLFNEEIPLKDRINFCHFIFENYAEDQIPMSLIRAQQLLLINRLKK